MTTDWTPAEIESMSPGRLESLWARPVELDVPRGVYRGRVLHRIDHAVSRRPLWKWTQRLGFELIPFGIDFDRRLWFFGSRHLAMGRFVAEPGPSRWRDTEAIALSYEVSRLPRRLRRVLYDEVKPLSGRWMLGIGGIAAGPGEGDHFFFALERLD